MLGTEMIYKKLLKKLKPKVIVDLGYGHSTLIFASQKIGRVYVVDSFSGNEESLYVGNLNSSDLQKYVKIIDINRQWDKEIDVLHINGINDYRQTKNLFEKWSQWVSNGIILLCHTTLHSNTVGKYFREIDLPKFNVESGSGLGVICRDYKLLNKLKEVSI